MFWFWLVIALNVAAWAAFLVWRHCGKPPMIRQAPGIGVEGVVYVKGVARRATIYANADKALMYGEKESSVMHNIFWPGINSDELPIARRPELEEMAEDWLVCREA